MKENNNKINEFIRKILFKNDNKLLLKEVNENTGENNKSENKPNKKLNRKTENLIVFIVILIITMILVKYIFSGENKDNNEALDEQNNIELVYENKETNINSNDYNYTLQENLKNILKKIKGVGEVDVLITFSETNKVVPIYNESISETKTEEADDAGGSRTIESHDSNKEIVSDSNSIPITEKIVMPKMEGAIITAEGASNITVKNNIISAVEAATGLAVHKIQVFEMNK